MSNAEFPKPLRDDEEVPKILTIEDSTPQPTDEVEVLTEDTRISDENEGELK